MEPPMAARAAKAVRARLVIPMHYATFPVLTQSADGFVKMLDKMHIRSRVMKPGESLTFKGKTLVHN